MLKKLALTAALALSLAGVGLTAAPTTADARPIWFGHMHNHFGHFGGGGGFFRHGGGVGLGLGLGLLLNQPYYYNDPYYYGGPTYVYRSYNSCGWLYSKARRTGSRYWWHRWHVCRFGY